MKHFSAWNFNKKRRLITIIILAFVLTLFLFLNPTKVLLTFTGPDEAVITKGDEENKKLALTFDISWGEEKVHDILKTLKQHETEATFFLSGEWAERHPQIVEKIQEDKHEIGMLGYRYKNYVEQDIEQVKKDMMYAKEIFEKLDIETSLIRPPSGVFDKETVELAESLDLEVIHWSVNPDDWKNPGTDKLTNQLTEQAENGDVVLLHASDSAKQTADALEQVIPVYKEKNLSMVTLTELLNDVSVNEKLIN